MKCTKLTYRTLEEAEKAIRAFKKDKRYAGGGRGLRKLKAFQCPDCHQWHTGHDNRKGVRLWKLPTPKIPTHGQLLRRLRRIEERLDGEKKHRAHVLGLLIQKQSEEEAQRDKQKLRETLSYIYAPRRPEDI
jgi:hypothetical protein